MARSPRVRAIGSARHAGWRATRSPHPRRFAWPLPRAGEVRWACQPISSPAAPASSGRICATRWSQRGDSVRVLDDLSTGSRDNLPSGVTLIEADVADPDAVRAAIEAVDGVFHLAAIASVARGVTDWLGTHRANLTGTITVFDAIRRGGAPIPVVYASSAAVYGDCATVPIAEDAERRPLSAYGADKYACELHARVASHVHGIPTTGLRFFNVYGPRQDPRSPYSGVISIFCERVARGAPIDVFGDGGQTRDFIFVADVVAALLAGMQHPAARRAGVQRLHRHAHQRARPRPYHRRPRRHDAGCAAQRTAGRGNPPLHRHATSCACRLRSRRAGAAARRIAQGAGLAHRKNLIPGRGRGRGRGRGGEGDGA